MEITKREVLASISIVVIMMLIGILISGKISEYQMEQNEKYNKAAKINDSELFEYGMKTSIGNAFVYGELEAVDTVSFPEIEGTYMYIEKQKEIYTKHTRTETYTDSNGKTKTRTKEYWSWDYAGSEELVCKEVIFCGVKFDSEKIRIPKGDYIDTIKESYYVRYQYYGTDIKHKGTIFAELKDKTISSGTEFYKDSTIEEVLKRNEFPLLMIGFWVVWVLLTVAILYGFFYMDNKWLE